MIKRVMRVGLSLGLSLGFAVACGGSTSGSAPDGGAGSGATAAGGGSGGGGAVAGGGSGGGVTGGSGGSAAGGGSGGNALSACDGPGQCFLFATNCCGYCGEAKLEGFIGVNHDKTKEANELYCAEPVACPDCIETPQPNFVALCETGQCTPLDIRKSKVSECQTKQDCRLRWGSGCCETCAGGPWDLIAISTNENFEALVCDPSGGDACPPCLPQPYPPGSSVECIAGHCVAAVQLPD